jgi:hypothetical protein
MAAVPNPIRILRGRPKQAEIILMREPSIAEKAIARVKPDAVEQFNKAMKTRIQQARAARAGR